MSDLRQRYLVTYDVSDARRLRRVFKCLKGYGTHLQLSVFRCDLTRMALAHCKSDLLACINADEDQVLFIDVGPTDGRAAEAIESLGKAYLDDEAGPTVI